MKMHTRIVQSLVIGLVVIALNACTKTQPVQETTELPAPTSVVTNDNTKPTEPASTATTEKPLLDFSVYKQWMIPRELFASGMVPSVTDDQNEAKTDCAGMENGLTNGGDLLSSLIADDELRKVLSLDVYTPEYVRKLENKIVNQIQLGKKNNLYAFYVCHLGPNVDVVAGYEWPQGKPTTHGPTEKFVGENVFGYGDKSTLAVVYNDTVTLYDSIQTLNNTATGAEVYPCDGELNGEMITWSCFAGLHLNAEDYVDGSNIIKWEIPVKGGTPKKTEYFEPVE